MQYEESFALRKGTHVFKGSLLRHVTIERFINKMRDKTLDHFDVLHGIGKVLYVPIVLCYGFNCNFKRKNIARYIAWWIFGFESKYKIKK